MCRWWAIWWPATRTATIPAPRFRSKARCAAIRSGSARPMAISVSCPAPRRSMPATLPRRPPRPPSTPTPPASTSARPHLAARSRPGLRRPPQQLRPPRRSAAGAHRSGQPHRLPPRLPAARRAPARGLPRAGAQLPAHRAAAAPGRAPLRRGDPPAARSGAGSAPPAGALRHRPRQPAGRGRAGAGGSGIGRADRRMRSQEPRAGASDDSGRRS